MAKKPPKRGKIGHIKVRDFSQTFVSHLAYNFGTDNYVSILLFASVTVSISADLKYNAGYFS